MKKPGPVKKYVARELKEFRYGNADARFINPYIKKAKELILAGLLYTLEELEETFPDIFPDPTLPLVLEIGCYMGATVIELAKFNKEINVLGIDIKYKRVVKSCIKIRKEGLKNCKIAICDAGELVSLLPDNSLLGAFVFFPDPWEKESQQKHRLLNQPFFEEIYSKLMEGGFIWLKTDNKPYFEQVMAKIEESHFTIIDALPEKIAVREYKTLFEEMFIEQKKTIYQIILQKG